MSDSNQPPTAGLVVPSDLATLLNMIRRRLGVTTLLAILVLFIPNLSNTVSVVDSFKKPAPTPAAIVAMSEDQHAALLKTLNEISTAQKLANNNFQHHVSAAGEKFDDLKVRIADLQKELRGK